MVGWGGVKQNYVQHVWPVKAIDVPRGIGLGGSALRNKTSKLVRCLAWWCVYSGFTAECARTPKAIVARYEKMIYREGSREKRNKRIQKQKQKEGYKLTSLKSLS